MKWQEWRAIAFKRDSFQGWQVNVFVHENYATNGDTTARKRQALIVALKTE